MKPRIPLPPACPLCRAYRGLWRRTADGSLARCECARGRMLATGKVKRVMGRVRVGAAPNASQQQMLEGQYKAAGPRSAPPVPMFDGKLAAAGKD